MIENISNFLVIPQNIFEFELNKVRIKPTSENNA